MNKGKNAENIEKKISELFDKIMKAESSGEHFSQKYRDWTKEISNPKFSSLISDLLSHFIKDSTSKSSQDKIYKILIKIYEFNKEQVSSQIQSNNDFIKAFIIYIKKCDESNISPDCLLLMIYVFNIEKYK